MVLVAKIPVRRAQLIAPFGPGAMVVVRGGISLIASGLDHWFEREDRSGVVDSQEFQISEWRLERLLRVDHFRLPPDYRIARPRDNTPNTHLTVPFLRFPQWHFCSACHLLQEFPLSRRGRIKCPKCEAEHKIRYMYQVPFVALCDRGHLQDFPWREWVHGSVAPTCQGDLRLVATGSATLSGQKVQCECGASRTLSQITQANPNGTTHLSSYLAKGSEFLCRGDRPWHGSSAQEPCSRPLRGSLRSASNVYYAQTRSAIYLPQAADPADQGLVELLQNVPLSSLIGMLAQLNAPLANIVSSLRSQHPALLQAHDDEQISTALELVLNNRDDCTGPGETAPPEQSEASLREDEFAVLRSERDEPQLRVQPTRLAEYEPEIRRHFSGVTLVDKLRETRVLLGFTRIFPDSEQSLQELRTLLWRRLPPPESSWLPGYVVYGEGILLELADARLRDWEQRQDVLARIRPLADHYRQLRQSRRLRDRPISPRFVLIHTLAHLIMNRLTFECGYGSASLRERLYVSDDPTLPMAGVLIYTADGDAEGTMGGLVRMGKAGYLEPVVRRALEAAQWCSADPVCMEMGERGGQGPNSCNLAACHNCALVPETACEEFNRFLDRAMVIGTPSKPDLGYFTFDQAG